MEHQLNQRSQIEEHCRKIFEVAKHRKLQRQVQLREQLQKLKLAAENEIVNPLAIFPEEIWLMILPRLDNVYDQINCANACTLFSSLLEIKKENFLFLNVFPLIEDYLQETRYSCSDVSKYWNAAVIQCSKQAFSSQAPCSNILEKIYNNPPPHVNINIKRCDDVEIPTSRPPIRGVLPADHDYEYLFVQVEAYFRPLFFEKYTNFLLDKGTPLLRLDLRGDDYLNISPSSLYMMCQNALQHCPNLKSFKIWGWRGITWTAAEPRDIDIAVDRKPAPCDHFHLERISFRLGTTKALCIQDRLVCRYSAQLKWLDVVHWNFELYSTLKWNKLRRLSVSGADTEKMLISLFKINAPQLVILGILLNSSNHKLEDLIRTVNRFQQLRVLQLTFSTKFNGWSNQHVLDVPEEVAGRNMINELKITCSDKEINHNFLVCFPAIKRLSYDFKHGYSFETSSMDSENGLPEKYIGNDARFLGEEEPDLLPPKIPFYLNHRIIYPYSSPYSRDDANDDVKANANDDEKADANDDEKANANDDEKSYANDYVKAAANEVELADAHRDAIIDIPQDKMDVAHLEHPDTSSEQKYNESGFEKNENEESSALSLALLYAAVAASQQKRIDLKTENNFFDLSTTSLTKFTFSRDYQHIYESNIWEILKSLDHLQLSYISGLDHIGGVITPLKCNYTRSRYNYLQDKTRDLDRQPGLITNVNQANQAGSSRSSRIKLAKLTPSTTLPGQSKDGSTSSP